MYDTEKFTKKKKRTLPVVYSYMRLSQKEENEVKSEYFLKKGTAIACCGDFLQFYKYRSGDVKLFNANFCKNRLCPMCAWRRSLKIYGQTSQILDYLKKEKYRYLFLTLTVKNCTPEDLNYTIDELFIALKRLFKYKKMCVVKGHFRALEVTYNKENDTCHPHFHLILAVHNSYFKKSEYYLSHDVIRELWQRALGVEYKPQVNIQAIKEDDKKSVAEMSKYPVKDADIVIEDDEELTDRILKIMDSCLKGRRLVAYGGEFLKAKKALLLDDVESGDLINTDIDEDPAGIIESIIEMKWRVGFANYEVIEKPYKK